MYGLIMLKEYAEEILSGKKTSDVRAYDTDKRGMIAIVDSKKAQIMGFVELVSTQEITPDDYVKWHLTGKWENAYFETDKNIKYYSYDFINPIKLEVPIKIERNGSVWCHIEENVLEKKVFSQIKLF